MRHILVREKIDVAVIARFAEVFRAGNQLC
jgi:hypothetical protein